MSLDILKTELKEKKFRRIYFLFGEEDYLKNHYYKSIKTSFLGSSDTADFYEYEYKDLSLQTFLDIVGSYSMISDRKMLVIKDMPIIKSNEILEFLSEHSDEIPEHVVVIIFQQTVSVSKTDTVFVQFCKNIKNNGLVVELGKSSQYDLADWIVRHVKNEGHSIDSKTAYYLIEVCGTSMTKLNNEIEKLCSFAATKEITRKHIDAVISPSFDFKLYNLTDAIVYRQPDKAYRIINELFEMSFEDVFIVSGIYKAFIDLYNIKCAQNEKVPVSQIAKDFSIRDFAVKKYLSAAASYSEDFLKYALKQCAKSDIDIKTSKLGSKILIENLVGRLLNQEEKVK